MSKIYAKVVGGIVSEYPIKPLHITNRGHKFTDYTEVRRVNKPTAQQFHDAIERRPVLVEDVWTQQFEIVPQSKESALENAKQRLAAIRYSKETGGIDIAEGVTVTTTRVEQAIINATYSSLKNGLVTQTDWKGNEGWITVDLASFEPVASMVSNHVRKSFAAEKVVCDLLDTKSFEELVATSIATEFETAYAAVV